MGSRGPKPEGDSLPLLELTGIEWTNETTCQSCSEGTYTNIMLVVAESGRIVLCPFCLALAIDRATGWKTYNMMSAWENTRKVHAAIRAGRVTLSPQTEDSKDGPTP